MTVEVSDDFLALLNLRLYDFNMLSFKLLRLILVVTSHRFELLPHVIGPCVAGCILSELGGIELVIKFVLDSFLLEVF